MIIGFIISISPYSKKHFDITGTNLCTLCTRSPCDSLFLLVLQMYHKEHQSLAQLNWVRLMQGKTLNERCEP